MSTELRRFTHEERLSIGRQISARVLSKYGDSVLVVYICGSTAKNLDRPYSDLEMIVVVQDGATIPGFTPASPEEVAEAASQLYGAVMEMVRSRGVSVEVDELVV